jgi:hypothetical protein
MDKFPENDWKILTKLKPVTLERLCQRIIDQAAGIAGSAQPGSQYESYLKLFTHIQESDQTIANGFDDLRRSNAFFKLVTWRREKLVTDEEFLMFSGETRNAVKRVLE